MIRYWNYRLVLLMDEVISLVSTMIAYVLVSELMIHPVIPRTYFLAWMGISVVASTISFYVFRTYRSIIRHTGLREMWRFGAVVISKSLILVAVILLLQRYASPFNRIATMYVILDGFITISALMLARVTMLILYTYYRNQFKGNGAKDLKHVLIYGTDEKSISLVTYLSNSPHYRVRGFLTYGTSLKNQHIAGLPVYYFDTRDNVNSVKSISGSDAFIFPETAKAKGEEQRLVRYASELQIPLLISPDISSLERSREGDRQIRKVNIEDLLGRPEIQISMKEIIANFKEKTVMVTGAAGSIGSELCRQLAGFGVDRLILFDNAETPMHTLRLELEDKFPYLKFIPVIGDVRQKPRLEFAFRTYHPQVVFHAAAYKHVPLMEENPCEAVLVNVVGTRNIADYCLKYDVEKMVMISTDKAVNPTNVMGCSKRLAEIYVQSLGQAIEQGKMKGKTKFVTTRFGNVLGSNGSVIPRFREQIAKGGPVTVTHPDITRFFMTIPEACRLVMEAATMTSGNQIFVFDMGESVKIATLAKRMIELAGLEVGKDIQIEYTGLRPGEKLYEEVLATTENTEATSHEKIRVAKVREYEYQEANEAVDHLEVLSRAVDVNAAVKLMKEVVPEFKSKNSRFEQLDVEMINQSK